MSSTKLQDTRSVYKNELYFYTFAINIQTQNVENDSMCNNIKDNKYLK